VYVYKSVDWIHLAQGWVPIEQCFSAAGPQPGTGPSSYKKRIYRAAVSQRLRTIAIEHGNKPSVTVKVEEHLDWLREF
jgi:hypothetical protein